MTTKISEANIQDATLETLRGPKISSIIVTNSSYVNLDDTAVALEGGYVKLIGSGFAAGCQVLLGLTPATSVTYISETEVRAQLPATAAGTYIIYLVNTDGGTAIRVNAVTFSGTPTWVSGSALGGVVDTAISIQLSATGATTFALAPGSTLPPGVSLSSGGLLSGTITGITQETVYNFTINAVDAELQDSPRSFAFTVIVGDLLFAATTLLLPGSATTFVQDASTNNFPVTVVGDTRPNTFNPYLTGWSNYFDGTGDYLTVPANAAFNFGSGDFSIEMWVYPIAQSQYGAILTFDTGDYPIAIGWYGQVSGNIVASAGTTSAWITESMSFGTTVKNTWTHLVFTRSGNNWRTFQDGVMRGFATAAGTVGDSSGSIHIGSNGNSGYTSNCYISNLRIIKGSIPAEYITASTTVNTRVFTPPTQPLEAIAGTSLLTCQSNRLIDNSTNNFAVTQNGDVTIDSFSPFVEPVTTGGSGYFDGTGDMLSVPASAAIATLTGDYTYECWVYPTSSSVSYRIIFGIDNYGGGLPFRMYQYGTNFQFWYTGNAGEFINSPTITINTWYHLAVTRSSGVIKFFVNGTQAGSNVTSTLNYPSSIFRIGMDSAGTYPFVGYISDLRVVKGTAVYTAAFTPPTAPLTAIANTSLLTLQNNQPTNNSMFLDSSTENFPITRNGNATQGTFSPYSPSGWSNYFDGTSDYLSIPNSTPLTLAGGNYTLEAWIYTTTNSNFQVIIGKRGSSSSDREYQLWLDSSTLRLACSDSGNNNYFSSQVVPLNTWCHVALTVVGSSLNATARLFFNGNLVFTTTTFNNSNLRTNLITVGSLTDSQSFQGYISNVRILKGTALYTANFTPPTQPLTAIAGTSLLTCQSPQFADNSPNRSAITRAGDTRVTNFSPFKAQIQTPVSYSAYFDGTNDYLTPAAAAAFTMATQDFTYECWVYLLGTSPVGAASALTIFDNRTAEPSITPSLFVSGSGNGSLLTYYVNGVAVIEASSAFPFNTWTHVALARNGGTTKLYQNGLQIGNAYSDTNNYAGTTTVIGGRFASVSGDFRSWFGYISNLRVVKGTAVYTADFTPPTQPLTSIANTSLLTCQSPTFVDNSTNNFAITAAGNSQPTQVNPFGSTFTNSTGYTAAEYSGSIYLDGTGDFLTIPDNPAIAIGSTNFTAEVWVYPTSTASGTIIFLNGNSSTYAALRVGTQNNQVYLLMTNTTGLWSISTGLLGSVPINAWHHIAVSKTGTTVRIFVNGTKVGADYDVSGSLLAGTINSIGAYTVSPFEYFVGYISNLRVIKGTALYTSNFTPPVAPVQPVPGTTLLLNRTGAGITDATTKTVIETVGDARISTVQSKFGGSSIFFDGTGDSLQLRGSEPIGSADFTIEGWAWLGAIGDAYYNFYGPYPFGIRYANNGFANRLQFSYDFNTASSIYNCPLQSGNAYNQWVHMAWTRSGGTNRFFFNGVQQNLGTGSGPSSFPLTSFSNSSSPPTNGVIGDGWVGYIQDFRITKGIARYTATFTPPAAAFQTR